MMDEISEYYFNGSIAYTEDAFPVKRLHFFKVPKQMSEDTLKAYFQSFGKVLEWRWYNDPNNMCEPCINVEEVVTIYCDKESSVGDDLNNILEPCLRGDVLFANAEDAARALLYHRDSIDSLLFEVGPSYSWKQPYANEIPSEEPSEPSEPSPILQLPDDCWFHILEYLDLRDKVRLARTCHRFRDIYKIASSALCKTIDSKQLVPMTLWDLRDFFQLTGDKVQSITFNSDSRLNFNDEILAMIADNCRNLISLSLDQETLKKDIMLKMPTSIVKLKLFKWGDIEDLDIICKHFFKLKELSCYVTDNTEEYENIVWGNYCPYLEEFHISCDDDIDCQILAQLPSLKRVSIDCWSYSEDPRGRIIDQLVKHKAEQLERFEGNGDSDLPRKQLSLIAKLTGLRILVLPLQRRITKDVLKEFAALRNLEEFRFYCNKVTHSDILDLFIACPKLSRLGVYGFPEPELVPKIAHRVRQEKARIEMHRKLPIQLDINLDKQKIENLILKNHRAVFEGIIKINSDIKYWNYNEIMERSDESDYDYDYD